MRDRVRSNQRLVRERDATDQPEQHPARDAGGGLRRGGPHGKMTRLPPLGSPAARFQFTVATAAMV
jgi:hypothetical protein